MAQKDPYAFNLLTHNLGSIKTNLPIKVIEKIKNNEIPHFRNLILSIIIGYLNGDLKIETSRRTFKTAYESRNMTLCIGDSPDVLKVNILDNKGKVLNPTSFKLEDLI